MGFFLFIPLDNLSSDGVELKRRDPSAPYCTHNTTTSFTAFSNFPFCLFYLLYVTEILTVLSTSDNRLSLYFEETKRFLCFNKRWRLVSSVSVMCISLSNTIYCIFIADESINDVCSLGMSTYYKLVKVGNCALICGAKDTQISHPSSKTNKQCNASLAERGRERESERDKRKRKTIRGIFDECSIPDSLIDAEALVSFFCRRIVCNRTPMKRHGTTLKEHCSYRYQIYVV